MRTFTVPTLYALAVVFLSVLLLTIGARSPYTHANLLPYYSQQYTRTEQAVVGPARTFRGARESVRPADGRELGKVLFVARGCAGCHGIDARSGVVGPPIVGADVNMLKEKAYRGPGGMPAYSAETLTDRDLAFIASYLQSLKGKTNP